MHYNLVSSWKYWTNGSRGYLHPVQLEYSLFIIDWSNGSHLSLLQFTVGLDGKKLEPESNVLLASIENMQYAVTLDVLNTVSLLLWATTGMGYFDFAPIINASSDSPLYKNPEDFFPCMRGYLERLLKNGGNSKGLCKQ